MTERRERTRDEIVAAAWDLAREHGLGGLSMRDLGDRVGMRAQSIYSYFASKHDIYDAMYLEGYKAFAERMDDVTGVFDVEGADADRTRTTGSEADATERARRGARAFAEFCTSDPVRYQLLFQRTIPGFTPSADSYAVAVDAYEAMRRQLALVGPFDDADLDMWTAVLTGLTSQQISNDPGGERWTRLVDRAVDMVVADVRARHHHGSEQP